MSPRHVTCIEQLYLVVHVRGDKFLWLLMLGTHPHKVVLEGCGQVVESAMKSSFPGGPLCELFVSRKRV